MGNDDVRRKLVEAAEDAGASLYDLRQQWKGETYELGSLTHEKYLLLLRWIEAEEAIKVIDCQILESRQALLMDHSSGTTVADQQ